MTGVASNLHTDFLKSPNSRFRLVSRCTTPFYTMTTNSPVGCAMLGTDTLLSLLLSWLFNQAFLLLIFT